MRGKLQTLHSAFADLMRVLIADEATKSQILAQSEVEAWYNQSQLLAKQFSEETKVGPA